MHDRPIEGKTTTQRLFILTASLLVGTLCWFLLGDGEPRTAVADTTAKTSEGKVLARIGDQNLTESEVIEGLTAELLKLDRQRHELIARAVEQGVRDILVEQEAAKRGMTPEALVAAEVDGKLDRVSEAEVDAFYEKGKAQIRQPKERVAGQIRRYLAMEDFVETLRVASDVEIHTEPFRVAVAADGPAAGPADAKVTVIEFSDFECPYCRQAASAVEKLRETHADSVRLVYRQFPLESIHPRARKAGEASLCADEQGKFWEMHDRIFAEKDIAADRLRAFAADLGLDTEAFGTCLDSGRHGETIDRDLEAGRRVGVERTPTFFINGRYITGAPTYEALVEVVDEELAKAGR